MHVKISFQEILLMP